ncbi:Quinol monooxygenase YgiN [Nannocystis exedens]|uniref:Quinol monooxygenase YgiN n=1 Tax=Nannocystis exedens TaxID=54 RepID=A0A1I1V311_9BACT|nr:putative quinol monooxygenase [Nannocystis exedens]PCC72303.1 antibiotic biosynthesis monooxygenase [Nannocystis exedens]SFD77289.1 Quinol monooxygenase YgiN [Nannocystis exedens]
MEDRSVHVVTTLSTRPQAPEAFAGAMRELVQAGRGLPGNRRFEAYQGTSDPREFVVIEVWDSDEAADAHLSADHTEQTFAAIGPLLAVPSAIVRHVRVA